MAKSYARKYVRTYAGTSGRLDAIIHVGINGRTQIKAEAKPHVPTYATVVPERMSEVNAKKYVGTRVNVRANNSVGTHSRTIPNFFEYVI